MRECSHVFNDIDSGVRKGEMKLLKCGLVDYFNAGTSFFEKSGGPKVSTLASICGLTVAVESGTTELADADFVFVEGAELVLESVGFFEGFLFGDFEALICVISANSFLGFCSSAASSHRSIHLAHSCLRNPPKTSASHSQLFLGFLPTKLVKHTRGVYEPTAAVYHHVRGGHPKRLFCLPTAGAGGSTGRGRIGMPVAST